MCNLALAALRAEALTLPPYPTGMRDCVVRLLWEMLGSSPSASVLSKIRVCMDGAHLPVDIAEVSGGGGLGVAY